MRAKQIVLEDNSGSVQKLLLFVLTKEVQVMTIKHDLTFVGFKSAKEAFD